MVYPPGEIYTPEPTPEPSPAKEMKWEDRIPKRPNLNYDIGEIKSESQ